MSNVLIGIIGVILFIGLALAGALFLGPRFQESSATSKAAAAHQAMAQVVQASNLYQVQEGTPLNAVNYASNMQTLVTTKFLKSAVSFAGSQPVTVDKDGYGRDMPVDHVQLIVGAEADQQARAICKEIEKQFGSPNPEAGIAPVTTAPGWGTRVSQRRAGGCFQYGASPGGSYYAYMSI
jgi:hypothetical protein